MDPMIATGKNHYHHHCHALTKHFPVSGGSAMMAIEVLKSRGVDEARIIFLNVVSCPKGIDNVLTRFPNVRIVSTMVDPGLNDDMYILPGLGDFGDRYALAFCAALLTLTPHVCSCLCVCCRYFGTDE